MGLRLFSPRPRLGRTPPSPAGKDRKMPSPMWVLEFHLSLFCFQCGYLSLTWVVLLCLFQNNACPPPWLIWRVLCFVMYLTAATEVQLENCYGVPRLIWLFTCVKLDFTIYLITWVSSMLTLRKVLLFCSLAEKYSLLGHK